MASAWIEHVKKYAKKHKISYKEAMSKARASYKPKTGKKKTTKGYKKGSKSKTHPGDMDFTTKKGSKDFHEGGHDVKKKRKPYQKKK